MNTASGRVPSAPGSCEPSPDGLGPSGFDPSRMQGPTCFWVGGVVEAILNQQERENATRADFKPAISRATVEAAINLLFALHECRSSDFAAAYRWTELWETFGLDWSRLPFVDRDRDRSGEAGETPQSGSTEGKSPGPSGHRPNNPTATPPQDKDA